MKQEHKSVKEMWRNYLTLIGSGVVNTDKKYISCNFCDNEKDANHLAKLAKQMVKRAWKGIFRRYVSSLRGI